MLFSCWHFFWKYTYYTFLRPVHFSLLFVALLCWCDLTWPCCFQRILANLFASVLIYQSLCTLSSTVDNDTAPLKQASKLGRPQNRHPCMIACPRSVPHFVSSPVGLCVLCLLHKKYAASQKAYVDSRQVSRVHASDLGYPKSARTSREHFIPQNTKHSI